MIKKPNIILFVSGLINILICLITVTIVLFRQDWFGKGDTYAFVIWTIPLAAALSVSGKTILNIFTPDYFLLRLLFITLTAAILSFVWAYFVALVLGPWIGAFSIPIIYLWIIGSIFQLLFMDWLLPKQTEKPQILKVIFGLFSFPLTLIGVVITIYLISMVS